MKWIIVALVGVNLGLCAYLGYEFFSQPAVEPAPTGEVGKSSAGTGLESTARVKFSNRTGRRVGPEQLGWESLASDDLKQYVANLRGAQCPEETIRDIVIAEVNRQFAPRERALKARAEDRQPWESLATYDRRSNEGKLRQLLLEKKVLLHDLLGVEVAVEMPPSLSGRSMDRFEAAFSALPESKRDQARLIQEKYWSKSDEIKRRTIGFIEPEDRAEFVRIKAERRQELGGILTPQEFEDYEITSSATATMVRSQMAALKPADEEFRKVFRLTLPVDEEYSLNKTARDTEDTELITRRKQAEHELQDRIKAALGDERYADLQRSRDPVYNGIASTMQDAGLPKETIVQVYDTQKLFQEESKKLMQDKTLQPQERAEALQSMQLQGEQALRQILGEQNFDALKGRLPLNSGKSAAQQRLQQVIKAAPNQP